MKILYGVQATGNGHISRSREVIRELKKRGHHVRVIISGREPTPFWDIDVCKPYDLLRGLTFVSVRGKLRYFKTALNLNLFRFYHDFYVYHRFDQAEECGHVHLRPYSRTGFLNDLNECNGVISNAGFELLSEAIHFGKKLLIKPLSGQMEQLSNAHVISKMNFGRIMKKLNRDSIDQFLMDEAQLPVRYPNVAQLTAYWIESGNWEDVEGLAQTSWKQVRSQPPT